jgi:hypothetical protein
MRSTSAVVLAVILASACAPNAVVQDTHAVSSDAASFSTEGQTVSRAHSAEGVEAGEPSRGRPSRSAEGLEPVWCFDTGAPIAGVAAANDGGGFIATYEGQLHALGATGRYLWSYTLEGQVSGRPSVAKDRVVVATSRAKLYSLTPKGALVWVARLPMVPITGVGADAAGTAYFVGRDGRLYAVSRWGTVLYSVAVGLAHEEPEVSSNGEISVRLDTGEIARVRGASSVTRESAAPRSHPEFRMDGSGRLVQSTSSDPDSVLASTSGGHTHVSASTRACSNPLGSFL